MTEVYPTQAEVLEAIDRIARTPDGAVLYVHLQRRLMGFPTSTKSGALRADHGERSFAAKLIGLMAKGIHESVGRNNPIGPSDGTRDVPVVVPRAEPVRIARASSTRRITEHTRVPGYDRFDE